MHYAHTLRNWRERFLNKKDKVLEILNLHPELAIAKKLTSESKSEQISAKLNECSNEEYEEFKKLNLEYKKKFKFPFIIAVVDHTKESILEAFEERLESDRDNQIEEAIKNIGRIVSTRVLGTVTEKRL